MTDVTVVIKALDQTKQGLSTAQKRVLEYHNNITRAAKQEMAIEKQKADFYKQTEKEAAAAKAKMEQGNRQMIAGAAKLAAAFVAVGVAAKKAYDFAKEGAQLEFTTIKFDRLAQTIGTTGDALLEKLRPATRGVMSDMELIASATDTMSLGLVNTEQDAVRLTTVMAGLGMDMNQVVLALSNQTTMRFDQLGVAVAGFDDKVKALMDTGMDANAAFTEAFLQQAEEQLQKVGHAADTTAGTFMRFEAAVSTASDRLKKGWAEAMEPAISLMADFVEANNEAVRSMDSVQDQLEEYLKIKGREDELEGLTGKARVAAAAALKVEADAYFNAQQRATEYNDAILAYYGVSKDVAQAQADLNNEMSYLSDIMGSGISDMQGDYIGSLKELGEALSSATVSERGDILEKIKAETDAYNERAAALMFNIQQQAIMAQVESGTLSTDQLQQIPQVMTELASSFGLIDENQKNVMDSTNELVGLWADGSIGVGDLAAGFEELTKQQLAIIPGLDETIALMEESGKNTSETQHMVASLVETLALLPESGTVWDYTINLGGGDMNPALSSNGAGSAIASKHAGGWLSGQDITLVGDGPGGALTPYTEAIIGGRYVLDAKATRQLYNSGMLQVSKSMNSGGPLLDGTMTVNDVIASLSTSQSTSGTVSAPPAPRPSRPSTSPRIGESSFTDEAPPPQMALSAIDTLITEQKALQKEMQTSNREAKKTNDILARIEERTMPKQDFVNGLLEAELRMG